MAIVVAVAGAGDIITGGLKNILGQSPDIQVMHTYPHYGEVPDVILYDAGTMAGDDGEELVALLEQRPPAPVVIVGHPLRPGLAARALTHGAAAQISLESPAEVVLSTIRAVATGGTTLATPRSAAAQHGSLLTPREVEVLQLITSGLSNSKIAVLLHLSPNSIKSIVRKAYRKIGATTRAQAVSWCMEHGFYGWREEAAD